ncbi:hypothetical protein CFC21_020057 [Triticum aestivum]|uniref:KIB1-4 beta-propeller domain-containing protein n=2 Tax=Triticum aestivum TaxID=4565 RepID=A0A9R1E7A4_WHEAT|nr:hypothetical protein CFC21_020032 [Triticum aestivum]KAF7004889.1 hypothetical protein CFC21_020057 [Triticum aestivum]
MESLRDMKAAVCSSRTSAMAVVVWFPCRGVVLAAVAGSGQWEVLHRMQLPVRNALLFQGRLYATRFCSDEIVQLYPPRQAPLDNVIATLPKAELFWRFVDTLHLVESAGQMLLVVRRVVARESSSEPQLLAFTIYSADFGDNNGGHPELTRVTSLGDRALFVPQHVRRLPVCLGQGPPFRGQQLHLLLHALLLAVQVGSLAAGHWCRSEELAAQCQIHDGEKRIRASVRPFTIADHLLTFCHAS